MTDDGLFAGMSLDVDPDMPPGVFDLRSAGNRLRSVLPDAVRVKVDALRQRAETDPGFAAELDEEIASLRETAPYITYPLGRTPTEKCEACDTPVSFVSERAIGTPPESRAKPALWEPGQWRKHTPRRCGAMRKEAGW